VVAGDGPDRARLEGLAARSGGAVRFAGRVSDEELLALYATCGAVIFPPADEDYGYIALEAFLSKKAVVTCTDSGGPLEFVVDGENGRVVAPDAAPLAAAVADLLAKPERARESGERGFERVREIRWENAVRALLDAGGIR
jgi:glycosyltransferase involved in cell wall biosynthesis